MKMKQSQPQPQAFSILQDAHKKFLLSQARKAIEHFLEGEELLSAENREAALNHKFGAFVTLLKEGTLRGCIGHIKDDLPLNQVVVSMALQAAFNDNRFTPVTAEELHQIEIEISVLSALREVQSMGEIELGRDGVLLKKGDFQAVFLPEVAIKMGWDIKQLLDRLCNKTGLPKGSWKKNASLFVFQTEVFSESQFM